MHRTSGKRHHHPSHSMTGLALRSRVPGVRLTQPSEMSHHGLASHGHRTQQPPNGSTRKLWPLLRPHPPASASQRAALGAQHNRPFAGDIPELHVLSGTGRSTHISRGCYGSARGSRRELLADESQCPHTLCATGQPGRAATAHSEEHPWGELSALAGRALDPGPSIPTSTSTARGPIRSAATSSRTALSSILISMVSKCHSRRGPQRGELRESRIHGQRRSMTLVSSSSARRSTTSTLEKIAAEPTTTSAIA